MKCPFVRQKTYQRLRDLTMVQMATMRADLNDARQHVRDAVDHRKVLTDRLKHAWLFGEQIVEPDALIHRITISWSDAELKRLGGVFDRDSIGDLLEITCQEAVFDQFQKFGLPVEGRTPGSPRGVRGGAHPDQRESRLSDAPGTGEPDAVS